MPRVTFTDGRKPKTKEKFILASGVGVEEVVWLSKLCPGMSVGIMFADEDIYHERVLIAPGSKASGDWMCLSPDLDQYVEGMRLRGGEDEAKVGFICKQTGEGSADSQGRFYRFTTYPSQSDFDRRVRAALPVMKAGYDSVWLPRHQVQMDGSFVANKAGDVDLATSESPPRKPRDAPSCSTRRPTPLRSRT